MKNKKIVVISLLVLVIAFIAGTYLYKSNETKKVQNVTTSEDGAPYIRAHSPKFGDNKKNVVVVEFLDPECEACAAFHPIMKRMYKENYEDISLVIRYLPNHRNSRFVVKLLEASRLQNKYNEALDVVFSTQDKWANHNNPQPGLLWTYIAKIEGIDIKKVEEDVKNSNFDEMMDIDSNDGRTLGVRGTPTIFVNGKKLAVLSYSTLIELVESEIYK
ncbi:MULTISPECIES: DsbA family protein [Arcobacteraceae]|uniref:Disulfide bond formation protein DsbA n=1 Tax=Poseidonibacter parvus TaxID=1850254 RepID=A0A1P8KLN6_9BACT|nr:MULTISPECIES: thioredoxin domain-containing protein [Arcobacteraceae]APW65446.1 disulfide bond formation protein DsbA [Poseidonibacter parvus]